MRTTRNNSDSPEEDQKNGMEKFDPNFYAQPIAFNYSYNFYSEITEPEKYTSLIRALRNAQPNDVISLHFACDGGRLDTMQIILSAMIASQAHIVGHLESHAASAAALLLLSCNEFQISNGSWMMFHNFSGLLGGKQHEIVANLANVTESFYKILESVSKSKKFLSDKELDDIKNGRDLYLNNSEVYSRLTVDEDDIPVKPKKSIPVKPKKPRRKKSS